MKEDIINFKKCLDNEKKYVKATIYGKDFCESVHYYSSGEIQDICVQEGHRNVYASYENNLMKIMKYLSSHGISYDEIITTFLPNYFIDKNTKEFYENVVEIKPYFEVFKNNEPIREIIGVNYLEKINYKGECYTVYYDSFVWQLQSRGYSFEIDTFEKLVEANRKSKYPIIDINFEKELTKELKLK